VPDSPDWRHVPVGAGGVVVEHVNPDAWFDRGLVPFGGHPVSTTVASMPIPDVVARARADFADILFTDDVARGP